MPSWPNASGAIRAERDAAWDLLDDTDLQAVWTRIEYHGIAYLLHNAAARLRGWPDGLLSRIAEEARLVVLWETTHHKVVAELIAALEKAGIEAIVMKGTALAYSLHTDPAMRRRGDTDLLVRPSDRQHTQRILAEHGWYLKGDPHGLYFQESWMHDAAGFFQHSIDLHWEPSDRPVLHSILPMEQFFERKTAMDGFGPGAFRPDFATMALHATINQKWHAIYGYEAEHGRIVGDRRLIWSVDFDLMARAMEPGDWERLITHCTAQKVSPLVAEALRGAQSDLGTVLPSEAMTQLEETPLDPDLETYFAKLDGLHQFWIDLRRARSLRDRLWLIGNRAFPPRDHLLEKFPNASGWPTSLLRGRMLWNTAGRVLKRTWSR